MLVLVAGHFRPITIDKGGMSPADHYYGLRYDDGKTCWDYVVETLKLEDAMSQRGVIVRAGCPYRWSTMACQYTVDPAQPGNGQNVHYKSDVFDSAWIEKHQNIYDLVLLPDLDGIWSGFFSEACCRASFQKTIVKLENDETAKEKMINALVKMSLRVPKLAKPGGWVRGSVPMRTPSGSFLENFYGNSVKSLFGRILA